MSCFSRSWWRGTREQIDELGVELRLVDSFLNLNFALAEHLDKQIGAAVDDFGMILEIGGRVDHPQHLDDVLHLVEIAAKRILDRRWFLDSFTFDAERARGLGESA